MFENLTIYELREKIKNRQISIKDVLDDTYSRIESVEPKIDAFVSFTKEYAYKRAEELQKKLDSGENIGILGGVPVAVKDNMCMKDTKTTCSSRMLENFVSPYNATVIKEIEQAGGIIVGKTNMDEFSIGCSTTSSYFKKTKNPWDLTKVAGGSSGGSAAAVASDMIYAALASDTGGSIRQPASFCSVVGFKPTYGLVSRFGLVALASSLEQIGAFTKDVQDAAIMLTTIAKYDNMDATSIDIEKDYSKLLSKDIKGLKIGVPTELLTGKIDTEIKNAFEQAINQLKQAGAEIKEIKLNYTKYAPEVYYIISSAEASSNLARYDGIKYGYRTENFEDLIDIYASSRAEGFNEEVKRRILFGTYVLSSKNYDAYYNKACKIRTLIIEELNSLFKEVDIIATPTTINAPFNIDKNDDNICELYLEKYYTSAVNLAGLPAISIPSGFGSENLPIGLQLIGKQFDDEKVLNTAYAFEQKTSYHKIKPTLKGGNK